MQSPRVFTAPAVLPVSLPPIADGAVLVDEGRVRAVGPRDDIVNTFPNTPETVLEGVMVPGLVNAHTHLQFTRFAHIGADTHGGFEAWSVAFDAEYSATAHQLDWLGSAKEGAELALASGTTTIADVCTDLQAGAALGQSGLAGVVYLEVLGHTWNQWLDGGRDRFLSDLGEASRLEGERVAVGISPHAPYSLDTRVLSDLGRIARQAGTRLHTHLAESAHEDEYCRFGTGPLADFVAGFGRDFQIIVEGGAAKGTAELAQSVGILGPEAHVAHGIYLDAGGRAVLRHEATAVALCPRSNRVIGLEPPPIAAYLTEGQAIAVGTDSLSSSPSLDLMQDVRDLYGLARAQGYDRDDLASRLIHAATAGGAMALGSRAHSGALQPGVWADMAVFDVDTRLETAELSLVHEGAGSCVQVITGGIARNSRLGADI